MELKSIKVKKIDPCMVYATRDKIGRLVHVPAEEVVLGQSYIVFPAVAGG